MGNLSQFRSICIDGKTAALLSAAEIEMAQADASISKSPLRGAACHQLLRIEATSSSSVDGRIVRYLDLVKLEAAVLNAPFLMDDCAHLYRLASKLDLENASDVIMAYRYMLAVDWTARNISKDSTVGPEIFEVLRNLYSEDEISALAALEYCSTKSHDLTRSEGSLANGKLKRPQVEEAAIDEYIELVNSNFLTPAAQAEISHAQLQLLKPYEGNLDSFERVFSHLIFYRRGLLTGSIAPLAVGPARDMKNHVRTLVSNMEKLRKVSPDNNSLNMSFRHSAYCTEIAAKISTLTLNLLTAYWLERQRDLKGMREDSATLGLAKLLIERPCISVDAASKLINRSFSATNNAMWGLVESSMVKEIGRISKHRLFCAVELVDIFAALTAKVISPKPLNRDELMEDLLRPCDKF